MKSIAFVFALTLTVSAGCRSTGAAEPLDALRQIKIESGTILTLGGKMPPAADFCNWNGTICALKPGTFGGTEKMSLSKTESGLISKFQFYYGSLSSDAIQAQIDDYTRTLGKPSREVKSKTEGVNSRELVWSDSATTFELSYKYTTDQNHAEASAALTDNALAAHN
jgi:hypothetical protein